MRRPMVLSVLAAWIVVALTGVTLAMNVTMRIPMQDMSVRETTHGNSYVVEFDVPADLVGKRLDSAFLDFVVDASPTSEAEAEATPFVTVFPLTAAATGATLEYESDVPSVRPVSMGEGQAVRMDITDIVKGWLAKPTSNHGLVIGALAGPEVLVPGAPTSPRAALRTPSGPGAP